MSEGASTPLVLELMGPPGSGKTTLAQQLAADPRLAVVKDHETGDLPALLRGVLAARAVLGARTGPGVSRLRWVAWAGRVTAAGDVVDRRVRAGARVVVLDQGPAYTLARMARVRSSPAVATWYEHRLRCCADLLTGVVLLDADTDTLLERVRSRSKGHLAQRLAADGALRALDAERASYRAVAEQLERRDVPVVRLDTALHDPDDQLLEVRAELFPRATKEL